MPNAKEVLEYLADKEKKYDAEMVLDELVEWNDRAIKSLRVYIGFISLDNADVLRRYGKLDALKLVQQKINQLKEEFKED